MHIDASEFEESIEDLSKILEKKLQRKISINHNLLRIEDGLSSSIIKDALKHALYKLKPKSYRIISKSGYLKIKKLKHRAYKSKKKKGIPPSVSQSLPYFFPR